MIEAMQLLKKRQAITNTVIPAKAGIQRLICGCLFRVKRDQQGLQKQAHGHGGEPQGPVHQHQGDSMVGVESERRLRRVRKYSRIAIANQA